MLVSLSIVLLGGYLMGTLCKKLRLPGLVGMIFVGVIVGPYVFNLLDDNTLNISSELRRIALVIILARAGLTLDITDFKKIGRPALLMCFVPACFEIVGMTILAPLFFDVSYLEAAIIGTVVAAVSPAVIVPKMIRLIEKKKGTEKGIPQLILAGASVDDVFVIVLFTSLTGLAQGGRLSVLEFAMVPGSILLGLAIGWLGGKIFSYIFARILLDGVIQVLLFLCVCFAFVSLGDFGLVSVMFMGIFLRKNGLDYAIQLSGSLNKMWVFAEIILFVLVGATVNISYALSAGFAAIGVLILTLVFRIVGVLTCLVKTRFNWKERLFCSISYLPKATVQAAIGGVPLAMGLECGELVLTIAVLAILITAPLGAFLIDMTYKKLI